MRLHLSDTITVERAFSWVIGLAWFGFAFWAIRDGVLAESPVHVLFFALNLLIAALYFLRTDPVAYPVSNWSYIIALVGTFYVFAFQPGAGDLGHVGIATILMCLGAAIAIWAAVSLGKSFGIRPVLRSVRVSGPYRFVRHPLYAAYILMDIGEVVGHPTAWNCCIAVIGAALLFWRSYLEEAVLSHDPAYSRYRRMVRSRIVPLP